jgi:MSHA biogenesis protein MshM
LVNIVANKALMLAYGEGRQRVLVKHIRDAASDTPEVRRDWLPWAAFASLMLLMSVAIGWAALA